MADQSTRTTTASIATNRSGASLGAVWSTYECRREQRSAGFLEQQGSHPALEAKVVVDCKPACEREHPEQRVAVSPMKLRHVFKVHAKHRREELTRHGYCCDHSQHVHGRVHLEVERVIVFLLERAHALQESVDIIAGLLEVIPHVLEVKLAIRVQHIVLNEVGNDALRGYHPSFEIVPLAHHGLDCRRKLRLILARYQIQRTLAQRGRELVQRGLELSDERLVAVADYVDEHIEEVHAVVLAKARIRHVELTLHAMEQVATVVVDDGNDGAQIWPADEHVRIHLDDARDFDNDVSVMAVRLGLAVIADRARRSRRVPRGFAAYERLARVHRAILPELLRENVLGRTAGADGVDTPRVRAASRSARLGSIHESEHREHHEEMRVEALDLRAGLAAVL
mmetsp:Transcript_1501/g.4574  ORF Transcript_1501/g.4574 Transcript_1501/m.4574 type:complete len:397 (-) Transcript_1501:881-2071(-)